jgi:hypothetical protein
MNQYTAPTNPTPPMILPMVTGTKLRIMAVKVNPS